MDFHSTNELLQSAIGFREGIAVNDLSGSFPVGTQSARLYVSGVASKIHLENLPEFSNITLKINGWDSFRTRSDETGVAVLSFDSDCIYNGDLSAHSQCYDGYHLNFNRIHCPQLVLPESERQVTYSIIAE